MRRFVTAPILEVEGSRHPGPDGLDMGCPDEVGTRLAAVSGRFATLAVQGWDLPWVFRTLAGTRRWLGQAADRTGCRLTVAHHSLWCARTAWRLLSDGDPVLRAGTALWALLHDGHEAWTGDLPRPLQLQMPVLLERQARIDDMILERIAADRPGLAAWAGERLWHRKLVERIDRAASTAEQELYVDSSGSGPMSSLPVAWPALPGRLAGPARAASRMAEGFDLLAGELELAAMTGGAGRRAPRARARVDGGDAGC